MLALADDAALARLVIAAVRRLPPRSFPMRGRGHARAASATGARGQAESIAFGSAMAYFLTKADSNGRFKPGEVAMERQCGPSTSLLASVGRFRNGPNCPQACAYWPLEATTTCSPDGVVAGRIIKAAASPEGAP